MISNVIHEVILDVIQSNPGHPLETGKPIYIFPEIKLLPAKQYR